MVVIGLRSWTVARKFPIFIVGGLVLGLEQLHGREVSPELHIGGAEVLSQERAPLGLFPFKIYMTKTFLLPMLNFSALTSFYFSPGVYFVGLLVVHIYHLLRVGREHASSRKDLDASDGN